jgi:hypothetical protein
MKKTLITTVLSLGLVAGFEFTNARAGQHEGAISVAQNDDSAEGIELASGPTELIGRGGRGGGMRRGGGGFRRGGGGMRRGGGMSRGGTRSAGVRRGGASVRRTSGTQRSHGTRSNARSQHASNTRSTHSQNARNSNRGGNNHNNGGHNRGWHGHPWDGGWDHVWDGGTIIPIDPFIPVTPVVIDPRPAVFTLLNPVRTGTSLTYTLGEGQYVLNAGETATYDEGTQVIAFDRGGSNGQARYTLTPGTNYQFVSTDHGWDLHSVTVDAGNEPVDARTADAGANKSSARSALSLVSGD